MTDFQFLLAFQSDNLTLDEIGRMMGCSRDAVRRRAERLGFARRSPPPRRPTPLCSENPSPEEQARLDARIRRRAAAIRRGWDDATEYSRRVVKGTNRWHLPCIGSSPSEPVFDVGVAPTFMTAPMRTEEQIYSARKKGSAA